MKKFVKFVGSRLFLTVFSLFLQMAIIYFGLRYIEQFEIFSVFSVFLGMLTSLLVFSRDDTQEYKLSWIFFILILPLFGTILYFILANKKHVLNKELLNSHHKNVGALLSNNNAPVKNESADILPYEDEKLLCTYIEKNADGFMFSGTNVTYYPLADLVYNPMINALKDAKKFIFMEFFIWDMGEFLDSVISVLKERVDAGVEVFVLYDDMGSINTLPKKFYQRLRSVGIKAVPFNPVRIGLSHKLNYRDHRKLCVIDGVRAFSGGINIADEYINRKIRFGHWKDNAYLIEGSGVFNYSVMFLQLWNFSAPDEFVVTDYSEYLPTFSYVGDNDDGNGLIQSYGDSPLEDENVAENVYILTINNAKKYLWLSSPYLILDTKMIDALSLAAKSGVDVRIITPSIPDKKIVFNMTQSNYGVLLRNGVKIYEYIPGFIHTKMFIADDKLAIVGTANMDFRSFYLHFECGSVFYGGKVVQDVKEDFLNTFKYCKTIPTDYVKNVSLHKRLFRLLLRIFAPML